MSFCQATVKIKEFGTAVILGQRSAIFNIIAVCINRLVMVSIDLSETAHFVTGYLRQHLRQIFFLTIFFFLTKFFSNKNLFLRFFLRLNFVSDWILSWTEFCLGLHTTVVFRMQSFNH